MNIKKDKEKKERDTIRKQIFTPSYTDQEKQTTHKKLHRFLKRALAKSYPQLQKLSPKTVLNFNDHLQKLSQKIPLLENNKLKQLC